MSKIKGLVVLNGGGFLAVLAHRNFPQVWAGQFISQIGSSLHAIAVSSYLKEATGSGSFVGVVVFFAGFVALACLPIAGIFADRYNRRSIVILCDGICAAAILMLAIVFLSYPTGGG